ncbi:hypothetical protein ACFO5Q_16070 [Kordiimonas lipolytica]|uniref:Cytochrome c domain-containing protein n=2 Tax=Kordiimonas lipolytica TaxID=1662421 RepID=A0ABV8UFY8_9PROT
MMQNFRKSLGLGMGALALLGASLGASVADDHGKTAKRYEGLNVPDRLGQQFPDFGRMPSPGVYDGRVFRLSQDYPRKKPNMKKDKAIQKILKIDFKEDWYAYAMAVRDYVFEGNAHANDIENSFNLEDNKVRNWYHIPWQHYGPNGREGFHGLTKEGPILKQMLAPEQVTPSYAYAVGFYNEPGGYTIGQVWPTPAYPDLSYMKAGNGFPIGTVVGKVLFTTLGADEVPYLEDPVSWNAYIYNGDIPGNTGKQCNQNQPECQSVTTVNLIQMDIMVRDPRADDTGGWVFGTFVYNGTLGNDNKWDNMIPVGMMWGNDPDYRMSSNNATPTKTIINPELKETVINQRMVDGKPELPPSHLGWGGRLNGPVDNPNSSCMSCHSTSQYPTVSAIMPFLNEPPVSIPAVGTEAPDDWMLWFRNVQCTTPFNPGEAVSLDYSLQLSQGINNYMTALTNREDGLFAYEYWYSSDNAGNKPGEDDTPNEKKTYPVLRGAN